jgi:hypothetical protein
MGRDGGDGNGALQSRYECKYLVTPGIASEIRQFISPFMIPDAHDRGSHGYPICSLYLDTLDLHLYRQTVAGEKNRFKLRVRSYSDDPSTPVYLEVKRRVNDVVLKRRTKLARSDVSALLSNGEGAWTDWRTRDVVADVESFAGHVSVAAARPFLRVKYLRMAYQTVGGDPLRVTFDTHVQWCPTFDDNLSHNGDGWIPTDLHETIVEIKFTDRYPAWVGEMIRVFGLHRQSVPKYVLSVDGYFAGGGQRGRHKHRPAGPPPGWDGRPEWARDA